MSTDLIPAPKLQDLCTARGNALTSYREAAEKIAEGDRFFAQAAASAHSRNINDALRDTYRYGDGASIDQFILRCTKTIDAAMWRHLMSFTNLAEVMDAKAKEDLEKSLENPEACTFENAVATLQTLSAKAPEIMERGVVELFKGLSGNYRTNNAFRIDKRLIMASLFCSTTGCSWQSWSYSSRQRNQLIDLERILHILDNKRPPTYAESFPMKLDNQRQAAREEIAGRTFEDDYLRLKWFKNGNGHVEIKRPDLVIKVNRIIAKWYGETLPDDSTDKPTRKGAAKSEPKQRTVDCESFVRDALREGSYRWDYSNGTRKARGFYLDRQYGRADYQKIAKVLNALGGKWNKSERAFMFEADADPEKLIDAVANGGDVVDSKKTRQAFYTPSTLAQDMVAKAGYGLSYGGRVLEPSAGGGALVQAALDVGAGEVVAVELDKTAADQLATRYVGNDRVTVQQASFGAADLECRSFDACLMNPPFDLECEHIALAYGFVRKGGKIVAIASNRVKHANGKHQQLREWLASVGGTITELPAGTFKESGAGVNTVLIEVTA